MSDKVFRVNPQSAECRQSICLADYEAAWEKHQSIQFERVNRESSSLGEGWQELGRDFGKFRNFVWRDFSYAEGMKIRVSSRQEQVFSWSDIAAGGRIEYSDIQGLMGLGLVEFLAPSHRCLSSRVSPQWTAWPVRNRRDFQTLVKDMQDLRPLHGEGMGNVFWSLCLPEIDESENKSSGQDLGKPLLAGMSAALSKSFFDSALVVSEEEPCGGGEIEYYDEDLARAVCEEDEDEDFSLGGTLKIGVQGLMSASMSSGVSFALAASAQSLGDLVVGPPPPL